MKADELKSSQAPLKSQYRERPETALVTLSGRGTRRRKRDVQNRNRKSAR